MHYSSFSSSFAPSSVTSLVLSSRSPSSSLFLAWCSHDKMPQLQRERERHWETRSKEIQRQQGRSCGSVGITDLPFVSPPSSCLPSFLSFSPSIPLFHFFSVCVSLSPPPYDDFPSSLPPSLPPSPLLSLLSLARTPVLTLKPWALGGHDTCVAGWNRRQ